MHDRFFSTQKIIASIATGDEKYKKSNQQKAGPDVDEVEDTAKEEEEGKRLDMFGRWLQEGGTAGGSDAEE